MTGRAAAAALRVFQAIQSVNKVWVVAGAIVLAGFFIGGQYYAVSVPNSDGIGYTFVINRFTGSAWFCYPAYCRAIP